MTTASGNLVITGLGNTDNILDQHTIESLMLQGQPYEVDSALASHGLLPEGQNIQEIKFIDNSYMWVRLG